ncbi:hypothetical protein [Paenibacillus chitinolyticus]|uniref:hypothetical protein n=1 Tax=Paenibacillus chitinolyticus TaxID=79263 RepID=UPI003D02F60A
MEDKELDMLREDKEALSADLGLVNSKQAKGAILKVVEEINSKIRVEESRRSATFETQIVDGMEMQIPQSMNEWHSMKFHQHDGTLYLIERGKTLDKDGSFHYHHYAWIPNGNKFTKLRVSTLGDEIHGDRAYVSASHYKHPSDDWSYMETSVRLDSHQYRPYIEHILKEAMGWDLKTIKAGMRR